MYPTIQNLRIYPVRKIFLLDKARELPSHKTAGAGDGSICYHFPSHPRTYNVSVGVAERQLKRVVFYFHSICAGSDPDQIE